MYEHLLETYRKASENLLHVQQDMWKSVLQQVPSAGAGAPGFGGDLDRGAGKRWLELAIEILNRNRESLDALYRSAILLIEKTVHMSDARSPEEQRRAIEDLWRKWFESVKSQSETQLRDVQTWADKSIEIVHSSAPNGQA